MEIPIIRIPFSADEKAELKGTLENILDSGMLSMGQYAHEFERLFRDFIGSTYAIVTNSGTGALEMILRAVGVEGKTVAVPSNTYIATALAAIHAGAKVIFVDCERDNLQISPEALMSKIRDDTAAVIIVHIGGIISPRYYEIKHICEERGIPLVEDAAHAHGATIDGLSAGILGLAAAFSFYGTKVLTSGEGGMITTNDRTIYEKGIILREHGKKDAAFNIHIDLGYTWTISEFQAMVGVQQVRKAHKIVQERRNLARKYDELLNDSDRVRKVKIPPHVQSSYYKYIVFLAEDIDRDRLKECMKKEYGVSLTGEVYALPCHRQPVFEYYPEKVVKVDLESLSNSEYVAKHHICLPLYPGMSNDEVEYVVESLERALKEIA